LLNLDDPGCTPALGPFFFWTKYISRFAIAEAAALSQGSRPLSVIQRPDIGAAMAAGLTRKLRLKIGYLK
jgi:hypothetical protein